MPSPTTLASCFSFLENMSQAETFSTFHTPHTGSYVTIHKSLPAGAKPHTPRTDAQTANTTQSGINRTLFVARSYNTIPNPNPTSQLRRLRCFMHKVQQHTPACILHGSILWDDVRVRMTMQTWQTFWYWTIPWSLIMTSLGPAAFKDRSILSCFSSVRHSHRRPDLSIPLFCPSIPLTGTAQFPQFNQKSALHPRSRTMPLHLAQISTLPFVICI
jgi:hypothetical protein